MFSHPSTAFLIRNPELQAVFSYGHTMGLYKGIITFSAWFSVFFLIIPSIPVVFLGPTDVFTEPAAITGSSHSRDAAAGSEPILAHIKLSCVSEVHDCTFTSTAVQLSFYRPLLCHLSVCLYSILSFPLF